MPAIDDTIAAVATAPGEAGLAVIRLSGPASRETLECVFRPRRAGPLAPRRLTLGWVVNPSTGEHLDEALAVIMPGPHSFTGQDVAEIHTHGGRLSPRRVLDAVLNAGVRLAEPGEFSLRAFLSGRLDLAQAEALLDVVQARTERAHRLALLGLEGHLSAQIRLLRADLLEAQAHLEASIDFADEDISPRDVAPLLQAVLERVRQLLIEADQGIVLRQGVRTAIVGRPNVGKSSLLNALLRADRAIVTPLPGTTRDTVEESASLDGVPFWLVDTAGLRESEDPLELLGMSRSRSALETADLVLLVLDASEELTAEDRALIDLVTGQPLVVALNKRDLAPRLDTSTLPSRLHDSPIVAVSALSGEGIPDLERQLIRAALGADSAGDPAVTNPRHRAALVRSAAALDAALQARSSGLPLDIQAAEVAAAARALAEVLGEQVAEDLLDAIFSRFCIGK